MDLVENPPVLRIFLGDDRTEYGTPDLIEWCIVEGVLMVEKVECCDLGVIAGPVAVKNFGVAVVTNVDSDLKSSDSRRRRLGREYDCLARLRNGCEPASAPFLVDVWERLSSVYPSS